MVSQTKQEAEVQINAGGAPATSHIQHAMEKFFKNLLIRVLEHNFHDEWESLHNTDIKILSLNQDYSESLAIIHSHSNPLSQYIKTTFSFFEMIS